ncbi:MAG: manno-octulosonate cytidylyltransferase [Pseudomonadota bacterium]
MSTLIVIPARYASQRFPGKPLQALVGATGLSKTLIERSWDAARAVAAQARVVVATDDARIRQAVEAFGGDVVMTPQTCRNGTERTAAALDALGGSFDYVVNFQGDAPLVPPWFVTDLMNALAARPEISMATPVLRTEPEALQGFIEDRQAGRVGGTTAVFGAGDRALYFSKEVLPYTGRSYGPGEVTPVFHHVGLYAFRPAALQAYLGWQPGPLESLEGLEQLRFLENDYPVHCIEVDAKGRAFWELNNPIDVPRIEGILRDQGME